MNPRVKSVTPADSYRLYLVFTNGEHGIYDCSPLLDFGVFRELKDPVYFRQVQVVHGSVAWPHEQDICPDTLYEDSCRGNEQQHLHAAEAYTPYGTPANTPQGTPK